MYLFILLLETIRNTEYGSFHVASKRLLDFGTAGCAVRAGAAESLDCQLVKLSEQS